VGLKTLTQSTLILLRSVTEYSLTVNVMQSEDVVVGDVVSYIVALCYYILRES